MLDQEYRMESAQKKSTQVKALIPWRAFLLPGDRTWAWEITTGISAGIDFVPYGIPTQATLEQLVPQVQHWDDRSCLTSVCSSEPALRKGGPCHFCYIVEDCEGGNCRQPGLRVAKCWGQSSKHNTNWKATWRIWNAALTVVIFESKFQARSTSFASRMRWNHLKASSGSPCL